MISVEHLDTQEQCAAWEKMFTSLSVIAPESQQVTEVVRVTFEIRSQPTLESLSDYLSRKVPPAFAVPLLTDHAQVDAELLVGVVLFPSGVVHTLESTCTVDHQSVTLLLADYWSLLDPQDKSMGQQPNKSISVNAMIVMISFSD